jgi:hypothetical protein
VTAARRARRGAVAVAWALAAAGAAGAQESVRVTGPPGSPIEFIVAPFLIETSGFTTDPVVALTLQLSATSQFPVPLFADTTVGGATATITLARVLPENATFFYRAVARTQAGRFVTSPLQAFRTGRRLELLSPNNPNGTTVTERRPTFRWRAARVAPPFRGWLFELRILSRDAQPLFTQTSTDTVVVLATDLEANTSYQWEVIARLATGDTAAVRSAATFVILPPDAPRATLLYQNFPNPFPSATVPTTCVWFDLRLPGRVALDVLDLRGHPVRRLVPGPTVDADLPSGRFGRASPQSGQGCDPRFAWDGTDATGRTVPPGVYLLRLRADGREFYRKAVWRGR